MDPHIKEALHALENPHPTPLASVVAHLNDETLALAVIQARNLVSAHDAAMEPVTRGIDAIEQSLQTGTVNTDLKRNFVAARLAYNAARYDSEAQLNRSIANLYELQVRRSNRQAERHPHARSLRFFYGMLGAQGAVIVATFAIAARKRNLLWTVAALAGAAAVSFAIHVYLFV